MQANRVRICCTLREKEKLPIRVASSSNTANETSFRVPLCTSFKLKGDSVINLWSDAIELNLFDAKIIT